MSVVAVIALLLVREWLSTDYESDILDLGAADQDYSGWQEISVPDLCVLKIPPSMEMQDDKYRQQSDVLKSRMSIEAKGNRIVVQQKGLNKSEADSRSTYARVIIHTTYSEPGDFLKYGAPLKLSENEIVEMDAGFRQTAEQDINKANHALKARLNSWDGTRVVRLNGIECLMTSLHRSLGDSPASHVQEFRFMNNDRFHIVTLSYRTTDKEQWADELLRVLKSIRFVER